ncbi:multimeric flavodoxin domain-containing protein [Paenibacillus kribbensis]|uniref:multimeric flavodoxin domain-containing protein n=1 Tax=Paenibacillus kribbensis TaxID=172713 RepID=UPI0015BDDC66|nr:multimeric flavodoxin domain-containing protein [Paenibacillus kribbensis]
MSYSEVTLEIKKILSNDKLSNVEVYKLLDHELTKLIGNLESINSNSRQVIVTEIEQMISEYKNWGLYLTSFLLTFTKDQSFLNDIFGYMEKEERIDVLHFIYWQITSCLFTTPKLKTEENTNRLRRLYRKYFEYFNNQIANKENWIPYEERNKDVVVVVAGQILSIRHSPTQVALDHCQALNNLKKNIYLINTADMPRSIVTPYFNTVLSNYVEGYNQTDGLMYENLKIPFFQCKKEMPDGDQITKLIKTIRHLKPLFVLSVSGSNVSADLFSNFVPVITLPLAYDLPISESTFSILPRKINTADLNMLEELNRSRESVIESVFTYKYTPPQTKMHREYWGLDEDNFVLAVVGNRLDTELDDSFLTELDDLLKCNDHARIMFIGDLKNYKKITNRYITLHKQSVHVGVQKDLAAVYEVCDAYLNTVRSGGGTSAAIALRQGLPVFTYAFGDVAHTAGEYYHINSFDDVKTFIKNWEDPVFREHEKTVAINRASEIFDSEKVIREIIETMTKLPHFY